MSPLQEAGLLLHSIHANGWRKHPAELAILDQFKDTLEFQLVSKKQLSWHAIHGPNRPICPVCKIKPLVKTRGFFVVEPKITCLVRLGRINNYNTRIRIPLGNHMKELLEKLLATDVLNEDTKAEIAAAFTKMVNEQVEQTRVQTELEVRTQLTEQWITERDNLIDAMDMQMTELLESEIAELKQDIAAFRDLEVEYAGKLVEARKDLAEQLDADIYTLATKLDEYIEDKLRAEMTELKESIDEVRKNELGRRAFEMFAREYQSSFVNKTEIERKLAESEQKMAAMKKQLSESETKYNSIARERKMEELLAPLAGKQRAVMETILKSVPTETLEEGYNMFLPRVLKESKQSVQEGKVLTESGKAAIEDGKTTTIKTGDGRQAPQLNESAAFGSPDLEKLRRLAGISH